VPLEYFDQAVAWLKARPEVDPRAIGAIGISRGSEAVLLLASRNHDVRAVGAFAPSSIVWQGLNFENPAAMKAAWTAGGKDVPFATPEGKAYQPNGPLKDMFELALAAAERRPETAIAVEKIRGPILLISGKADGLWPSAAFGQRIEARLKAKRFAYPVTHLSYDGAGHAVFAGDPSSPGLVTRAKAPADPFLGGDGPSDARAWADDWPKTLAFFDQALKGPRR
jgi:dienelactone hydrolase